MAKGYSIRRATNYTRNKTGRWQVHSIAVWDDKGHTKIYPTIEDARENAVRLMAERNNDLTPDEKRYIVYCKIYFGKEYIETIKA